MKRWTKVIVCAIALFATLQSSSEAFAGRYNRSKARNVINKTAYVIDQAYDVAYFYNYWSSTYLSRAVYYHDYAQKLYSHRSYRSAIRYSLRAREYALYVLDNCDDYWEYFYYTYYGWSHRYGYNPGFAYASGYRDGYYDGYYAAYCDRHHHDYRHDPHYRPHGHYDNRPHGGHQPAHKENNTAIGRGNTGTVTTSSGNGGGTTITRPGFVPSTSSSKGEYKNLNFGEYFSDEEQKFLKDMPNEQTLEGEFRKNNPSVTFNDQFLSTNKAVLQRNKENAQNFTSSGKDKEIKNISIEKPKQTTISRGSNGGKIDSKPVLEKPVRKQNEPISPEIQKPQRNNPTTVPERKPNLEKPQPNRNNNVSSPTINRNDKNIRNNEVRERKTESKPAKTTINNRSERKVSSSTRSQSKSSSKVSSSKQSSKTKSSSSISRTQKNESKSSSKKLQRR